MAARQISAAARAGDRGGPDGEVHQFRDIFGVALTLLDGDKGTPVVRFFDRVQQAMVMIIHMVMWVAPFGVAALIADVVGKPVYLGLAMGVDKRLRLKPQNLLTNLPLVTRV